MSQDQPVSCWHWFSVPLPFLVVHSFGVSSLASLSLWRESWVLVSCVFIETESQAGQESGCPPGYPLRIGLHGVLGLGPEPRGPVARSLCIVASRPFFTYLLVSVLGSLWESCQRRGNTVLLLSLEVFTAGTIWVKADQPVGEPQS